MDRSIELGRAKELVTLIRKLDLPEYHALALSRLILLGKAKAPELAKASNVPRTRIYDVLEDLFKIGLVKRKPGRPVVYYSIHPRDIARNLAIWRKRKLREEIRELEALEKEIERMKIPIPAESTELLRVVQVGAPSEVETNKIIQKAKREIDIASRAFEYYGRVKESLIEAHSRGVLIKILLKSPDLMDERDRARQAMVMKWLRRDIPKTDLGFSNKLPIRTVIVDASEDYSSGEAVFIVEQRDVPLLMREAAVTNNPSLVYGLKLYFDSLWKEKISNL